MIGNPCKQGYMWNPSTCDCECDKACGFNEYLDLKSCSSKLVLECEDEILNTTETLLNDKKSLCKKSNYLIHTISLAIICFLLLVFICVGCYFYYTKYQPKQKHFLAFQDTSIKLDIKNML